MTGEESSAPLGADAGDAEIRALVARLGRPHASGGTVVERAALLAEGAKLDAAVAWILAHGGLPEGDARAAPQHGLHGSRSERPGGVASTAPRRFVLPADALTRAPSAG
jgi:hypothetical protein